MVGNIVPGAFTPVLLNTQIVPWSLAAMLSSRPERLQSELQIEEDGFQKTAIFSNI
jgi:hypothetical protein